MKQTKLIYGIRALLEALELGKELDKILLKQGLRSSEIQTITSLASKRAIPIQYVPGQKLDRLTRGNHQGVIAFIATIEYTALEQLVPMLYEQGRMPFLLILDGITDVRNFGAIARTAECAGVDGIILPLKGSVSVTADAVKTSAGALLRLPICRVEHIGESIKYLQQSGIQIVTASEKASRVYTEEKLHLPLALVLGNEETGPQESSLRLSDKLIRIPQVGHIGSLNVSVAAGVIVYEVIRQSISIES